MITRFLGSVRFTLILLLLVALFATIGTWVEGASDSHKLAERLVYKQYAFLFLLLGFFLNILLAALRRWPWRRRHIPFLFAHLGLLMILAGTAIKSLFGVQGEMRIWEGSSASRVALPGQLALRVGDHQLPLSAATHTLHPHCKVEFDLTAGGEPITLEVAEQVRAIGPQGEAVMPAALQATLTYDGEVRIALPLPLDRLLLTPEMRLAGQLAACAESGDLAPPLLALRGDRSCEEFAEQLALWLVAWRESGLWLYPETGELSDEFAAMVAGAHWTPATLAGMGWCSRLLACSAEEIRSGGWPLDLDGICDEELPSALCRQLFEIAPLLPVPPMGEMTPGRKAHLLSSYLRACDIDLDHLDSSGDITLTHVESTVTRRVTPIAPLKRLEDNRPMIAIEDGPALPLNGVGWPMGDQLAYLETKEIDLPYSIHLRSARRIPYASSDQPYAYEADIWVQGKMHTLSMNRVYEGSGGYRFYLSQIFGDEEERQGVQLTVNRDPARWPLTYPGAFFLSMGVLLLYPILKGSRV